MQARRRRGDIIDELTTVVPSFARRVIAAIT
jgi:hypothetical protein